MSPSKSQRSFPLESAARGPSLASRMASSTQRGDYLLRKLAFADGGVGLPLFANVIDR
jgi:hypothetical protein